MPCQNCKSERIAEISAKSSDLNHIAVGNKETDGYVTEGLGIGGGDYVDFSWCLECGQIQGSFPVEIPPEYIPDEPIEELNVDD